MLNARWICTIGGSGASDDRTRSDGVSDIGTSQLFKQQTIYFMYYGNINITIWYDGVSINFTATGGRFL